MTPDTEKLLRAQLLRDEELRTHPYTDTKGNLTIGVGHNLSANGLSAAAIELCLVEDMRVAEEACEHIFVAFSSIDAIRQAALINMAFNLGETALKGFVALRARVEARDWVGAAAEAQASRWFLQTGLRAQRLVIQLRTGVVVA